MDKKKFNLAGCFMLTVIVLMIATVISVLIWDKPIGNLIVDLLPESLRPIAGWLFLIFAGIFCLFIFWKVLFVWVIRPIGLLIKKIAEKGK
jgi:hypothetical protein